MIPRTLFQAQRMASAYPMAIRRPVGQSVAAMTTISFRLPLSHPTRAASIPTSSASARSTPSVPTEGFRQISHNQRRWLSDSTLDNDVINAFEIFGVEQSFTVDLAKLKTLYRTLMAKHHPDVAAHQSQNAVDSQKYDASIITHAYQQLRNPHKRALHLLELAGHAQDEGTSSLAMDNMEILQQVMEIREEIDSVMIAHADEEDSRDRDAALQPLFHENTQRLQKVCEELTTVFAQKNWPQAQTLVGELQYWNRIDETIRERMDQVEE